MYIKFNILNFSALQVYLNLHYSIMFEGELEESMAELEESRRKLINLKMQKDGVSSMQVPIPVPVIVPNAVNGTVSPEKPADRSKRLRELKESIEEIKVFILWPTPDTSLFPLALSLIYINVKVEYCVGTCRGSAF